MPYANGVFTRLRSWVADKAAGLNIQPDLMDSDANDMALGLSTAMLRDGTSTATADLPMGGHKLTSLGAPVNVGDALGLGLTPSTEISRSLGFQPASSGAVGGNQIGFAYDGTGITASVNGNAGFGRVWTANTLGAAQLNAIAGVGQIWGTANLGAAQINAIAGVGQIFGTGNFNPASKLGSDGTAAYAGISGQPLPYIVNNSGTAYYMARCNGANLISFRWNGSQPVIQVDTSEFGLQTTSDARLKDVQGDVSSQDAALQLAALRPVAYVWNEHYDLMSQRPGKHYGFLAQELEKTLPTAIQDGIKNPDGTQYLMLSGDAAIQVCALLVAASRDLTARVAALEARPV